MKGFCIIGFTITYLGLRILTEKADCMSNGFSLSAGVLFGVSWMVIAMIVEGLI